VDGQTISEINAGLVVFLGVGKGDGETQADYLAKKIANMRIFADENGKINLSLSQVVGEILAVSQFTLYANTDHGNRPDFLAAESPDKANALYEYFVAALEREGARVKKGVFGAHMNIEQENDGPFTVIMEKK
jgi:D-tyrosyl-tRNA(Tyr) deacylase